MINKFYYYLFLLIVTSFSFAQEKIIVREYTHNACDTDSKTTSRVIAFYQVKKILLEEISVYIESTFEIETNERIKELTQNQIISITAGITETKILEEKWSGSRYYIKAEIIIDTKELKIKLSKVSKNIGKTKLLVDVNNNAKQAMAELVEIGNDFEETNSKNEKFQLQLEYKKSLNILLAYDWFQKGRSSFKLGEYDNSILYHQKASNLDSTNTCYYISLGEVLSKKGKYAEANLSYEKAKLLRSKLLYFENTEGIFEYNKGFNYYRKGNYEKAIFYYEKGFELDPDFPIVFLYLADAYALKKDYNKAIEYYKKSIEIIPNYINNYTNIAYSYYKANNYKKAIEYYEVAIDLDPNYQKVYYYLGKIYERKDDMPTSIKYYKQAAQLGSEEARNILQKYYMNFK